MKILALPVLLALAAPAWAQERAPDAAPPAEQPAQQPPSQPPSQPPAQEKVLARRLADVVAVREGVRAAERVLYYFNPTAALAEKDHLEQGSGGHSEILLSGGGLVTLYATAHVVLDRLSPEGDVLSVPLLTRLEARAAERPLQLLLPGGTACHVLGTSILIWVEPGRLRIRNEGGTPVSVTGDMRPERETLADAVPGHVELARGEEIRIVLVGGDLEESGELTELWGAVPVRHDPDVTLRPAGGELRALAAEGQAPEACRLTVRGVRTVPRAGLVVRNPAHMTLPPALLPPVEAPPAEPPVEPPVEPAPADQAQPPAPTDEGAAKDVPAGGGSP